MILHEAPDESSFGKIAGDGRPGCPAIRAFDEIRIQIAELVVVQRGIHDIGVVQVGVQIVDERRFRYSSNASDLNACPVGAVVFAYLNDTVVGSGVEQSRLNRRLRQR